ncbi:protein of unknown function [Nitrospira japonica]|uniref:Uncharacterized protein n=1 Tax=Nitrospira japonica TaxID=1325564 RepID=A0A1W1IAC7_9BACT|nr:hypothetical protein [Nitrospira japonica]SLM49871.1 protein of unknown function [Nitrospira japonica]
MTRTDPRTDPVLGLSLVQVVLLLVFAVLLVQVTDNGANGQPDTRQSAAVPESVSQSAAQSDALPPTTESTRTDPGLQAKLDDAAETSRRLEKRLAEVTALVDEVKGMVGAKAASRDGFQEAVENMKRGYTLCQKDNVLIEASIQNGEESIRVIGDIPSGLDTSLAKGEYTSDLDQIVPFMQDVYQYEKDRKCRFNYRLQYVTDNDYRKARERFEKYFFPEKMTKVQ